MSEVDLKQFCSEDRFGLLNPFSIGKFTYASNGHIMVRVPRRDDVQENSAAPSHEKVERYFIGFDPSLFQPHQAIDIPENHVVCLDCDGSGKEHHCKNCDFPCDSCDGSGVLVGQIGRISVCIGAAYFDAEYVRLIQSLPNLKVVVPSTKEDIAMPFSFDGGEGCLMPREIPAAQHIGRHPKGAK